jgi:hypothetical protein
MAAGRRCFDIDTRWCMGTNGQRVGKEESVEQYPSGAIEDAAGNQRVLGLVDSASLSCAPLRAYFVVTMPGGGH